jgi:hypothetical protein
MPLHCQRKLRERVTRAWTAKKRNADNKIVTSNTPFCLEVVDGKIVKKPEQVKIVREMFRLATLALGAKKIAQKINVGCYQPNVIYAWWLLLRLCLAPQVLPPDPNSPSK